ncbi:MAG: hypothetical protein EOO41_01830 [Methanobacteriota archaeon]|nr:MAG: hypothetical protein EOO41_01830 [Euryarchaeota archaeon]
MRRAAHTHVCTPHPTMDEDDEYDASLLELEDAPVQRGSSCRLDVPPLAVLPPPPPQHQAGAGARYLRTDSLPLVPAATPAGDSWRAVAFDALPAVMTSAQSNNVPSVSAAPLPATNVPLAATALQPTHTVLDEDEEEDDIFRAVVVASLPSPDAPLPSLRSQPDLPLSSTPTPQRQTLHSSPVQQSVPYTLAEAPVRDAVGRASHSPAARRVHAPPPAAPASPATPATQGSTSSRAPTGVGDPFGSSWMGGSWYVACEALNLPADTWVSNTLGSEATCDMEACLLAQLCNIGAIVRCPRPALRGLPQVRMVWECALRE